MSVRAREHCASFAIEASTYDRHALQFTNLPSQHVCVRLCGYVCMWVFSVPECVCVCVCEWRWVFRLQLQQSVSTFFHFRHASLRSPSLPLFCNVMKCVCIKMQFEVQSYNIIMASISARASVCVCVWAPGEPLSRILPYTTWPCHFFSRFMCAKWAYKKPCLAASFRKGSSAILWILKILTASPHLYTLVCVCK